MYRAILITLAIMATHFVMANGTADSLSAQTDTTIMTDTIKQQRQTRRTSATRPRQHTPIQLETAGSAHHTDRKRQHLDTQRLGGMGKWRNKRRTARGDTPKITIDDYTQYAPMLAVYGLNLCGVKGDTDYWTAPSYWPLLMP